MKNILLTLTFCGAAGIGYAAWNTPENLFESNEMTHAQAVSEHMLRQSVQELEVAATSYATKAELEQAADKLYSTLWGGNWGFNCRPQILGLGADDIIGGSVAKRHYAVDELKEDAALEGDVQWIWQYMYALIKESDQLIETALNTVAIAEDEKAQYVGEAHFLKAFAYYQLVRWFGDVPAYKDSEQKEDILGNTIIGRNEVKDVYEKVIVPNLLFAAEKLPEQGRLGVAGANSTPTKWAAKTCLAEVYLTMAGWPLNQTDKYALAKETAKEVITSGKYSLLPNYEDLWKESTCGDDTEHIFALNHTIVGSSNYGISYMAMEESAGAWSDYLADSCFYERYPEDTRKTFNFVTKFGEGKRAKDFRKSEMRSPAINKYRDYGGIEPLSAQTSGITPIYRYADALLIYAEAQNKADKGPDDLAYQCINQIRKRAGSAELAAGLSEADFDKAVFDERGWEFFAEFKRWFQLVRTEKVYEANLHNPRVKASFEARGITADNREIYLKPLPALENDKYAVQIRDNGFDNADLTRGFKTKPYIFNEWVTNNPQPNSVQFAIVDDAEHGKVAKMTGAPGTWYKDYLAQRLKGKGERDTYRLSFYARSTNEAQLRVYSFLTKEDDSDAAGGRFFVIKQDNLAESKKASVIFKLTENWVKYTVDFDLSKVQPDFWEGKPVEESTDVDLTNFCILFYNQNNAESYIDDVHFNKLSSLENNKPKAFDFESVSELEQWSAENSTVSLSNEHRSEGIQALCWDTKDGGTLTVSVGEFTIGSQSAFFEIRNSQPCDDEITIEFLDENGKASKTGRISMNFKGWREFNRFYSDYENKNAATITDIRFTYHGKSAGNTKIYLDKVNFDAPKPSNWKVLYQDLMMPDLEYLYKDRNQLLKAFAAGQNKVINEPTAQEIADFQKLKTALGKTPTTTTSMKALRIYMSSLGLTRNEDGSINGPALGGSDELTIDQMIEISGRVEALAAHAKNGDEEAKSFLNDYVDYVLDQGILYDFERLTYSHYGSVDDIPAGFIAAMSEYTEDQRKEMIKAMTWILEANMVYADNDYLISWLNADYLCNYFKHLFALAVAPTDQKEAIQNLKDMVRFMELHTMYTPAGREVLKVDGTGFHHDTHYNAYMYAYKAWCNYISALKGTCFQVKKDSYERIRKAIVSMYLMAVKGKDRTEYYAANSLCGRHPYTDGGGIVPSEPWYIDRLIDAGGEILGTDYDMELAAFYNYFFMTDKYDVDPAKVDGYYQFNYSPAGIYRQDNWVATMRSATTQFWGSEIYTTSNRFGRYQSHGTLEVMYDGGPALNGYPLETAPNATGSKMSGGWDWNVAPGATTVHYTSWKEMMPRKSTEGTYSQYSKKDFAGALAWGQYGVFGTDFLQSDDWGGQQFTPTNLQFKKSVFAFDGMLISMGSDIAAKGTYGDDMITATNLFQGIDHAGISSDLVVNGQVMAPGAEDITNSSEQDMWLVTPQTTGYFIPKGNDPIIIKHANQTAPREDGSDVNGEMNTVMAAKAYINHGVKPENKEYLFVAVPATTPEKMQQLAAKLANNGGEIFKVEARNEKLHALTYKPQGITAYTFFGAADGLGFGNVMSSDSEMLLMEKANEEAKTIAFAVANPNLRPKAHDLFKWIEQETDATIIVKGKWKLQKEVDGVTVTLLADGNTQVRLHLEQGEPVYFTLQDPDATGIYEMDSETAMKVTVSEEQVTVDNVNGVVTVYDVAGKVISSKEADGSTTFAIHESGCYIVKCGSEVAKIVVR